MNTHKSKYNTQQAAKLSMSSKSYVEVRELKREKKAGC
jgi:hypothetical protein